MDKILQGILIILAMLSIILAILYFMNYIDNSYGVILSSAIAIVAIVKCFVTKKDRDWIAEI